MGSYETGEEAFSAAKQHRLVLLDSKREAAMRIGKHYSYSQGLGPGECLLQAEDLSLEAGAAVFWIHSLNNLLRGLVQQYNEQGPSGESLEFQNYEYEAQVKFKCKVVGSLQTPQGKYPQTADTLTVIMEYDHFLTVAADYIYWTFPESFRDFLRRPGLLYSYADSLVVSSPHPRESHYQSESMDLVQWQVTHYVNSLIKETSGIFTLKAEMPLLKELRTYDLALLLLSLIFKIVIIVFTSVAILVVQGLVEVRVEEQMFELGVNRMLGLGQLEAVLYMAAMRTLTYVFPALALSFFLSSYILSWLSRAVFKD